MLQLAGSAGKRELEQQGFLQRAEIVVGDQGKNDLAAFPMDGETLHVVDLMRGFALVEDLAIDAGSGPERTRVDAAKTAAEAPEERKAAFQDHGVAIGQESEVGDVIAAGEDHLEGTLPRARQDEAAAAFREPDKRPVQGRAQGCNAEGFQTAVAGQIPQLLRHGNRNAADDASRAGAIEADHLMIALDADEGGIACKRKALRVVIARAP